MADRRVIERIEAWQAAGLIDAATAARLRAAEADRPAEDGADGAAPGVVEGVARLDGAAATAGGGIPSLMGSIFGPAPSITEAFAYIGAGFLVVAWHILVGPLFPQQFAGEFATPNTAGAAVEWGVPALVLGIVGFAFSAGTVARRRAAGVAFAVATLHVWGGVNAAMPYDVAFQDRNVVPTVATVAGALLFRWRYAALATQTTLLAAIGAFGVAAYATLGARLFPVTDIGEATGDPKVRAITMTAWWLIVALAFAGLALREVRARARASSREAAAGAERRANVSRFAAGLTAVLGTFAGLSLGDRFAPGALEPAVGDVLVLLECGFLVWLAARRGSAYLYPAAIGVIVALSHLNAVYLAEQSGVGVGLLVEGAILLGAGFIADRVRRTFAPPPPGTGLVQLHGTDPAEAAEVVDLPAGGSAR